jgi:hypothetical protein
MPEGGVMDGALTVQECNAICGPPTSSTDSYECVAVSPTEIECTFVYDVCKQPSGRRPARFVPRRSRGATREGVWLAAVAQLEAASVDAFETLRDDLLRFGAPASLRRRAESAAEDERRHTVLMGTLARSRGAIPCAPRRSSSRPRSLRAVARENAVEGCVRETFGALLAWHQAIHAEDPDVRAVMREIAADETRHAALAFDVDAWASSILEARDVRAIRRAEHGARRALTLHAPRETARRLGLPAPRAARRLARSLFQCVPERIGARI